jgi:hypothetical protein
VKLVAMADAFSDRITGVKNTGADDISDSSGVKEI